MRFQLGQQLFLQEIKRVFSYRVNFWLQFVAQVIGEIGVAYFLWVAIYESTGQEVIGGYSLNQMLNYYIFVALLGRLIKGRESFTVSTEIYEGTLTKFLVYPANYFFFKIIEHIAFLGLSIFQLAIGLSVFILAFDINSGGFLGFDSLVMGLLSALSASFFYFVLLVTIELVAFWADNVWSLTVMTRFIVGFLGGLWLPLGLFPDWAIEILAWTPFPSLASVPIQIFIGEAGWNEFIEAQAMLCLWMIPMTIIMFSVWKRGISEYTGVGQ